MAGAGCYLLLPLGDERAAVIVIFGGTLHVRDAVPDAAEQQAQLLCRIGYGIPDMKRATENDDHRSTFISQGEQEIAAGACHVYQVRIPDELRRAGSDYD